MTVALIVISEQLLQEISIVTQKAKLKKYFPQSKVTELISLLNTIGIKFEIPEKHKLCRDPKDNFLVDLAAISQADYLVTGDKDLLVLDPFESTRIISPNDFELVFSQ